jgi:hypothetical protein
MSHVFLLPVHRCGLEGTIIQMFPVSSISDIANRPALADHPPLR